MDKRKIIIAGVVLIGLFATFFILNGRALREAKSLTKELELRVDSLETIATDYEAIQKRYEMLYKDLGMAREKADALKNRIDEIVNTRASSITVVKNKLSVLVTEFDTLDYDIPLDTVALDSLKF
ncbi:MAG: hypothetical protein ABJG78_19455 [Cyclobacteriaceae bacterium]